MKHLSILHLGFLLLTVVPMSSLGVSPPPPPFQPNVQRVDIDAIYKANNLDALGLNGKVCSMIETLSWHSKELGKFETKMERTIRDVRFNQQGFMIEETVLVYGSDSNPRGITERTFDQYGNLTNETKLGADGTRHTIEYLLQYDDEDRLTEMLRIDDGLESHKTVYVHNEVGLLTKIEYSNAGGISHGARPGMPLEPVCEIAYDYDDQGNLIEATRRSNYGWSMTITIIRDEQGEAMEMSQQYCGSVLWREIYREGKLAEFIRNKNGKSVEERRAYSYSIVGNGVVVTRYLDGEYKGQNVYGYDDYENIIREENYQSAYSPLSNRNEYNPGFGCDLPRSTIVNPVGLKFKHEYTYDDRGNWVTHRKKVVYSETETINSFSRINRTIIYWDDPPDALKAEDLRQDES